MKKFNLVGNPNTGKTTLFNSLTGGHEHVGNWHGVTVEEKVGRYKYKNQDIEIVDLPGIYSLTSLSYEEQVAIDYILKYRDRPVINICDASNIQRNLYLTLSLLELGVKVLLVINQIEKSPICKIDTARLQRVLGLQVVIVNASDKSSLVKLNEMLIKFNEDNIEAKLPYINNIILPKLNMEEKDRNLEKFYLLKLLERDETVAKKFNVNLQDIPYKLEEIASARYSYIDEVLAKCISLKQKVYGQSKLDRIFMNRFLALPIFIGLLALAFYLTFFSIGALCSEGLNYILDRFITSPVSSWLRSSLGENSWVVGLFEVAIAGGLGSILSFLPQVALLFFFLSLLEDSGYLSRIAFVFEDILGKVGLSGKSVYTLLMGFGCSTTAVLTARNMDDKNSKIKTGLLTPYMSCSAKFPIYAVIGGAFFGANNIFVILGLYLLGVVVAILLSYIFEKTILKSKEQTFILEFPPYRMMSGKRVLSVLWENVRLFLVRVGTLIVSMNIIVWVLGSFSFTFQYVAGGNGESMLETLGRILAPIFAPLGFGSWALVSALIAGLVAKEVIVSSIAMFNGVESSVGSILQDSLKNPASAVYFASPSSALAYLVFSLLYFPCLATATVLSKEIGKKWTIIGIVIELVVAYIIAMLVYNVARAIEVFGAIKVLCIIGAIIIVLVALVYVVKLIKRSNVCPFKKSCDRSCKKCKKK